MDMDIDGTVERTGDKEKAKPILLLLVGAPGSGKSTFCEQVLRSSSRPWVRVCQDTINNGKSGTKVQCLMKANSALKKGQSVFIDRCNLGREQRADFVKLASPEVELHAVVLDLPAKLCISRSVKRTGHEGNLQGGKAAAVVNRMLQKKELPKLNEGFARITFCQNETDVQAAIDTYGELGPIDILPHGCFGEKKPDAKVQLGIMKFLKKVDVPPNKESNTDTIGKEVKGSEDTKAGVVGLNYCSKDVPTLAFPSISTADFQFDLDKASDIIVEKVEEFIKKLGDARLVLVDLSRGSKILSLVRDKATRKNIDPEKFFTFVGDITQLYSEGGLRCNVIANAANWRLKPGGGGVNAAIYNAAGPELEVATKEKAKSLSPGNAVVVSLPSSSPLYNREKVTHVIHVLGPNMNPQRPNCLDRDYVKGCEILQQAYSSLFEGFMSIVRSQAKLLDKKNANFRSEPSVSGNHSEDSLGNRLLNSDQKMKRDNAYDNERSKKSKGSQIDHINSSAIGKLIADSEKASEHTTKAWGSWAQALYHIAMHPERHKDELLEISDNVVVLNDLYPKAQKHLLVLARLEGLDRLADARKEHLLLLKTVHDVGMKWAEKFLTEDASLAFRLGYHSVQSMRQLHLHVISQDFNSKHLKHKKHWNSFTTAFFRDSVDVIEEISNHGIAKLEGDDSLLYMELRCHRCRSAHPNIPRLKSHITKCRAPFPYTLLQNGRLVLAPSNIDNP